MKIKLKLIFLSLLLPSLPYAKSAVVYEVIKGKGVEVCEAYKKNLESFNEKEPMICERKINPEMKEFSKPKWEKVNLEEHQHFLRRLLKYQSGSRDQFSNGAYDENKDLEHSLSYHKSRGYRFIYHALYDINNSGHLNELVRYKEGVCPDLSTSYFGTNIFLIRKKPPPGVDDWVIYDKTNIELILRNNISHGSGNFTTTDIFNYKDKVYIDRYCIGKNSHKGCDYSDELTVFKIKNVMVNEVCKFVVK